MLTFLLQFSHTATRSVNSDNDSSSWVITLAFFSPVLLYLFYYFFHKNLGTKWEKGIFPTNMEYTRDNLLEAYICLGARLIQADREEAGAKVRFMNEHFNKYFPSQNYDFADSLRFSYQNPIQVKTVSQWMKLNMHYDKRMQVLYFLVGLCYVDGSMNSRESTLLNEIVDVLEITPKDYQSILSVYFQRYHRTEEPKKYTSQAAIRLSCEILGVSEIASLDEIKKAYRQMAKKHHPDRFVTESPEQQRIALERFQEIQKAYEILEKHR